MRKALSMVFAIVLTVPFLSLVSGAMTEKTLYADTPVEWAVSYDPRTDASDLVPESDNKALPFFSDGADTPYTFYTFLNSNQRGVYNTVKEKLFESSIDVALPSPLTWDGTSTSVPSNIKSALSDAVTGGLSALCDDYPMIFWINGYSISYGYSYHQTSSGYHFTISSVTVKPRINTNAYADMNKVKQDYNDMAAVVDSVEIKGATRYEKVKFIHDFICKRVEYDEKFEIPTAHEPTSVFLTPYKTVCEGYSESFKILCDKAGIPCVIAVGNSNGGGHAWNYVKMEDGKWYGVDCTFDDQGDILYDYFLVGTASGNRYFGASETFGSSHTETGKRYGGSFTLTYPTVSENAYSPVVPEINSGATVNEKSKLLYITNGASVNSAVYMQSGYSFTSGGNKTGSIFTVSNTSFGTSTGYTVIMRGDVVPSGYVDGSDFDAVVKHSVEDKKLGDGSSEYLAADVNGDGVVDLFDAAEIDLIKAGKAS